MKKDILKNILSIFFLAVGLAIVAFASGALFVVDEANQVVITEFGKPKGKPITSAGLHFKRPFIQVAHYFEKRIFGWDGDPMQIPTKV
jgi:membrane protease subunit HflC